MCHHETKYDDFGIRYAISENDVKLTSDDIGVARGGKGAILRGTLLSSERQPTVGIRRLYIKGNIEREILKERERAEQALKREIAIWCNLKNQNVLELLGIAMLPPTPHNYLPRSTVFYYYVYGDLQEYRATNKPGDLEILELLRDTTAGLAYIHQHNIVHGDLKAANVVVEHPGKARICDFGSAYVSGCANCIASPPDAFDSLVSQRYLSPEICNGRSRQTTRRSDIWALGCVLLEVLTGIPPYKSNNDHAFGWIRKQLKGEYPAEHSAFFSSSISRDVGIIAFHCWELEPDRRPQAQTVLENLEQLCVGYAE